MNPALHTIKPLWPLLVVVPLVLLLHVVSPAGAFEITVDIDNTLHAPGFGALAVFTFGLLRRYSSGSLPYLLAFLITVAISVVSELMQIVTSRDSSPVDFANDVIGIVSFLLIASVFDSRARSLISSKISSAGFFLLVLTGFAVTLGPLIWHFTAFELRRRAAPMILNFENSWQSTFYDSLGDAVLELVTTPDNWPGHGQQTLLVKTDDEDYSGFKAKPIINWSAYSTFGFVIASADNRPHRVTVRVHDLDHNNDYNDRFNQSFVITNSPLRINISLTVIEAAPRGRLLQLDRVASFAVFISDPDGSEEFLIDEIQLN